MVNTAAFNNRVSLNGLHGIMIGVGEISGGLVFGIFGYVTNRLGRYPVVVLGTFLQFVAFVCVFINIPNNAPTVEDVTFDNAILIPSNTGLAIFSSIILGFGDACYNTQVLSLLGGIYRDEAGPAFAIFKFVQCVAAAAGFVYAGYIPLYYHVGMLWVIGTVGTIVFIKIDIQTARKEKKNPVEEDALDNSTVEVIASKEVAEHL